MADEQAISAQDLERDAGESTAAGEVPGADLEQVRDLLFGKQMRASDKRLGRLEDRLAKGLEDVRAEARRRLDALEQYAKRELESLSLRLKEERAARGEELKRLEDELRETAGSLTRRIEEHQEQTARATSELHQEVLEQAKALSDDFGQRIEDHSGVMDLELRGIRERMTERSRLSALFAELALQLGDREEDDEG